jgi:2'-5' RNA ligase
VRLFIAVDFSAEIKEELYAAVRLLETSCLGGMWTRKENLHLTLAFLGEVPDRRAAAARKAMETPRCAPFSLRFSGAGRFRRAEGDLYWLGIETAGALEELAADLHRALRKEGFVLEDRPFVPHLTLGRRVRAAQQDAPLRVLNEQTPALSVLVDTISLMRSERVEGRLVYTPMRHRTLSDA